MGRKLEEIVVTVLRQKFRRDDFAILDASCHNGSGDYGIGIKGNCDEEGSDSLQYQQSYRLYGHWDKPYNGAKQFAFKTFVECEPHGRQGVVRYLERAPNIGKARAQKLWNRFKSRAVDVLRDEPDVAQAAIGKGFTLKQAEQAAEHLEKHKKLQACTIDLIDLLGGRGFPKSVARQAVQIWGNRAAEVIKANPYLLFMRFKGCGFKRSDSLYLELGHPADRLKRQALCCWHAIAKSSDGSTWLRVEVAAESLKKELGAGVQVRPVEAIVLAKRAKLIATRRDENNQLWLAEYDKAKAEGFIARHIAEAWESAPDQLGQYAVPPIHVDWPWDAIHADDDLTEHQKEHSGNSMLGIIGILGGSPGTGKTFSAAKIAKAIIREHGLASIAVAAPTGKAAVRLTEALQEYNIPLQATTIHRLLQVESQDDGSGWSFHYNQENPLPFKFILLDETSMVDTNLMASFLAARGKDTHVLMIGDINQLLPVGHGAPLRDFIRAYLPAGELREIKRNSGTIVQACAQIRDGVPFETSERINVEAGQNLKVVGAASPVRQIEKMKAVLGAIQVDGFDPVWDCQVLVPVNAKSRICRNALNKVLQAELNPLGETAKGSPFRTGDKVVCLKNSFFPLDEQDDEFDPLADDQKVFVANGELGRVVKVAPKITTVKLSSPSRLIKVPRGTGGDNREGAGTGCDWDLGFALSVHKSQGSEWKVVIVMIDEYPGARLVCDRSWVYTAISRAKKLCFLIGKRATADGMCQRVMINKRKTFLAERIEEEIWELNKKPEAVAV